MMLVLILKLSFMSDYWLGVINLKNAKRLRKKLVERIKELMLVVWSVPGDEKKGVKQFVIDEKQYNVSSTVSTKMNTLINQ